MLKKFFVAVVLALVAIVSAPLAANAAGYVPSSNITVTGSATPGGTVVVSFSSGSFNGGEDVSFSVTGSGSATISAFHAATVSATKVASASGSVSANVRLPSDATGTYTLTAVGLSSGNIGTAAFTVVPADAGSSGGLAYTGSTLPMLLIWGAGGALVLGLALFLVLGLARRQRARA